ncbi:DUF3806 domain-containing protein [bacterium]|nr:DUF3806 domain-containing protein [bacterium]
MLTVKLRDLIGMIAQLSTSRQVSQLMLHERLGLLVIFSLFSLITVTPLWAQGSDIERRIEPLSPLDRQFMAGQRTTIGKFANDFGRTLSGHADRDLDTLQRILDSNIISREDTLTQQAMGIVLGDLLAKELSMQWVVYRDRAGRSRALRYGNEDIYLYPVSMISRRYSADSSKSVRSIYDAVVKATRPRLPGAKWRE